MWLLSASLLACSAYAADGQITTEAAQQMLRSRGIGKLVMVREADGTQIRGKILGFDESVVRLQEGSKSTSVPYHRIVEVKGPGLPRGAKIGIVVVVVLVALGLVGKRV